MIKNLISLTVALTIAMPSIVVAAAPAETRDLTAKKAAVAQIREELKNKMEAEREKFEQAREVAKQEAKQKIEASRIQLKEGLVKIKDAGKKTVVEKIDRRLEELNNLRLRHYSEMLDKLVKTLERIAGRADKAKEKGLDIASVTAAIAESQTAITAAREAIKTQASKTYTAAITTEKDLKRDVGAARKALRDNLKALEEVVKNAKTKTHDAATTLAQIRSEKKETTTAPTNSTPTNTQ